MVRFSNSSLRRTQYIVQGIRPVTGSQTSIIPPISPAQAPADEVPPVSEFVAAKTAVGISSTAFDVALSPDMPQSKVDLGLLYSNGYRYKYIDFKAGTIECSTEVPDTVVTVEIKTDNGSIFVEEYLSGYTLVKAYVANNIVIPQLPNPNVISTRLPIPSKLPPLPTNNNNC